jgi:hypothetical protein
VIDINSAVSTRKIASVGTTHMVRIAKAAGVKVWEVGRKP